MTDLRTAAQQALEAMLNFPDDISDEMFESITALKAALAEDALQKFTEVSQEIEAALAEPVQGPVANDDKVICPACCHQFRAIPPNVQQMMLDAGFEPPFTTPPQRKPLTEEEIDSVWDSEKAFPDIYAIVRAIERAHGIK